MEELKTPIPTRVYNASEGGHVAGANDIIDDDLKLTQAQINSIVLGDAVSVSLNYSSTAIDVVSQGEGTASVALTASISTPADSIKIKKNGNEIATGTGTQLSYTDSFNIADAIAQYIAEFALGGLPKTSTRNLGVIYFGGGTDSTAAKKAIVKASPAGTYNVVVPHNEDYVYILVPSSMSINSAKMSGFDFPLESSTNVTIGSATFKCYRSSNTYDVGTLTIVIS